MWQGETPAYESFLLPRQFEFFVILVAVTQLAPVRQRSRISKLMTLSKKFHSPPTAPVAEASLWTP